MKAIRFHEFGSEDVLRLEDLPTPVPGEHEVLVRMKAVAINPADLTIRAGRWQLWPIPLPFVPGVEGAGVVEKGGSRFKPGDKVIVSAGGQGLCAELVTVTEALLAPVPEGVSLEQAAGVRSTSLTAYLALTRVAGLRACFESKAEVTLPI
jgi:NADPH2:quinone reductase